MRNNRRRLLVVALPEDVTDADIQRLTRAYELHLFPACDGVQLDEERLAVELANVMGDEMDDALNQPYLEPTADAPGCRFVVRPKGGRPEDWAGVVEQLADGNWRAEVRVDGRPDGMDTEVLACAPFNRRAAARLVLAAWNGGRP